MQFQKNDIPQPDVSVIIVSYNTAAMTAECIESVIRETKGIEYEIIVFDNNSSDNSPAEIRSKFPGVMVIESEENLGFAQGNNLAAEKASGRYLLLLNPDTVVLDNAISKVFSFMETTSDAGATGGVTYFEDGSQNATSFWYRPTIWSQLCVILAFNHLFPRSRLFNPESSLSWKMEHPVTVDIITGCFLLIRTDLWKDLDGFDPGFFMYGEDADLSLRIQEIGKKCYVTPEARIIHHGGGSDPYSAKKMIAILKSKCMLFDKHWSKQYAWTLKSLLTGWVLSRVCLLSILRIVNKKYQEKYSKWLNVFKKRQDWSLFS